MQTGRSNRYFLNYNTKGDYQTELKCEALICTNYRLSQTELIRLLVIKKILGSAPCCYPYGGRGIEEIILTDYDKFYIASFIILLLNQIQFNFPC